MSNFDVTTPAGSDLLSQGDDKIREFKLAMREALRAGEVAGDDIEGVEAIFPGSSPATAPVYRYRGLKGTTAERPTAGQYGLYFDTTRNVLQRDNGTSWDDIGQNVIPAGTKMVFYQASAPVGWTAVAVNDKFLRVVTAGGTGGSTGGSGATPSSTITLAHSHTVSSHTHTVASHSHDLAYTTFTDLDGTITGTILSLNTSGAPLGTGDSFNNSSTTKRIIQNSTESGGSGTSGGAAPTTDSQLSNTAFQYADIIVASKD
ncbi:MAG: hypothetical protein IPN19_11340 [Elusimicrobia bacterium]|nr:hypothetical protein [Elusimicrobiota bacterium]